MKTAKKKNPATVAGVGYRSLDEIRAKNEEIGHHWFSPRTLAFFQSRIMKDLHLGAFFISSEMDTYRAEPRREYTIRGAKPCGCIETVGEFGQYATLAEARKALYALTPAHRLVFLGECAEHPTEPATVAPAAPTIVETLPELMTAGELCRRYGVTPQTFANWENRYPDFPAPVKVVQVRKRGALRAFWNVSECDKWVSAYRMYLISRLPSVPAT